MTTDYCPHGIYQGWRNGSCLACRGTPFQESNVPKTPRLRDAAMWAAFVHELRAELLEEARRGPIQVADDGSNSLVGAPIFDCPKCGRHDGGLIGQGMVNPCSSGCFYNARVKP